MKKIGIITFHRALNYGALLQAFALNYTLKKMGAESYIIDYHNPTIEKLYYYPSFSQRKHIKDKIKFILQGKTEKKCRTRFEEFRENYLNLSDQIYNPLNIASASLQYDLFIVGSDQVWNYGAHDFDENYFLSFVKDRQKKYSYAASFGISSLPDNYRTRYRSLLEDFVVCSVREEQGLQILRDLGISRNRLDLDPTMLLTKNDWEKIFNITQQINEYIFVYCFELTNTLKSYIEELAKRTNCQVVYLGNSFKSPFHCKSKALKTADPADFVKTIANAKYIVTNSFHGSVFSIIFNKSFYVELLKKDKKVNSRIENLLKILSLESRIISDDFLNEDINWETVNNKIIKLREESLSYLKELVNE